MKNRTISATDPDWLEKVEAAQARGEGVAVDFSKCRTEGERLDKLDQYLGVTEEKTRGWPLVAVWLGIGAFTFLFWAIVAAFFEGGKGPVMHWLVNIASVFGIGAVGIMLGREIAAVFRCLME